MSPKEEWAETLGDRSGGKQQDPGTKQMGKEKCRCQWGYQVTGQASRKETDSEKRKEKHLKGEISVFFLLCPI